MNFGVLARALGLVGRSAARDSLSLAEGRLLKTFTGAGASLVLGLAVPTAITLATAPPERKGKEILSNVGVYLMTAGMAPARQMFAQMAFMAAPQVGEAVRMVVNANRSALEARTMAAVPFSYSSQSMDIALGSLQYARSRMGQAYNTAGNEAAFMAARYLARA